MMETFIGGLFLTILGLIGLCGVVAFGYLLFLVSRFVKSEIEVARMDALDSDRSLSPELHERVQRILNVLRRESKEDSEESKEWH